MKLKLESHFAPFIEGLIVQKQALGYPYISSSRCLCSFDFFCKANYPDETFLTKAVAEGWATKRISEHVNGLAQRIIPVRQLAKYIIRLGIDAYILPDGVPGKQIRYVPYMFTRKEVERFFKAADHLEYNHDSKIRHIVVPVMFRMMYACGLRAGETRALNRKHFNPVEQTLFIEESKGHKDRMIYMADDVCRLIQKYDSIIESIYPGREYLFVSPRGTKISHNAFSCYFHLVLQKSGIKSDTQQIRPYDFRHAYAVHRINHWINDEEDFNALLPYLSRHMGHTRFEDTSYYIHLTSEFYPELKERMSCTHNSVIPGDDYEDE